MQGLIEVYTGDGKGKTTAAVGLAVRALGHGIPVLWVSFLKPLDPSPGEMLFLADVPHLELIASGIGVFGGAPPESIAESVAQTFAAARKRLDEGKFGLAVFDEINNAVHRGCLPLADLLDLLDHRPPMTELVLTGRHAAPEVMERAHLVTRMEAVKHPYADGVPARRGVEY